MLLKFKNCNLYSGMATKMATSLSMVYKVGSSLGFFAFNALVSIDLAMS